jgi:hypothetical protein
VMMSDSSCVSLLVVFSFFYVSHFSALGKSLVIGPPSGLPIPDPTLTTPDYVYSRPDALPRSLRLA